MEVAPQHTQKLKVDWTVGLDSTQKASPPSAPCSATANNTQTLIKHLATLKKSAKSVCQNTAPM